MLIYFHSINREAMSNKRVYVVRGNQDGNIGAYSNVKKAYEKAHEYVSLSWAAHKGIEGSYSAACKSLRQEGRAIYTVSTKGWEIEADIESYILNQ